MEAILNSFFLVLFSEMGDKTQLLALILAAKYRKPWTVMLGVLTATILNHAFASWFGSWVASLFSPLTMSWILAISFFIFGLWILIPDKNEDLKPTSHHGAFVATTVSFFLAEMGDKTQLATIALGAKYSAPISVSIGTTAGMIVADGLAVFLGEKLTQKVSMAWLRRLASLSFILFGLILLLGW